VQHSWIKGENGQYVLLISIEDTSKKKETKEISNLQAQKVRESILKAFGEGSGWTYSKNPDGEDYSAYTGDKG
jgi:hypothetical protein